MPKPLRGVTVVGLDTASDRWHAIYGPADAKAAVLGSASVERLTGRRWVSSDHRRHVLYERAELFFRALPAGSHVFCEEPLALQNGNTTRVLGLAAGAIWAAHLSCDLFWHWVNNVTWKTEIVGKGNADKQAIEGFVVRTERVTYGAEDFYDAFCLRKYGVEQLVKQCLNT